MENRIRKIQRILPSDTAALCLSVPSCRYLTGFDYDDGGVLLTADKGFLLTDSRYVEAAQEAVSHLTVISCTTLMGTLGELLEKNGIRALYVEQSLSLAALSRLQKLPCTLVTDTTLSDALTAARVEKDQAEIAALRKAQEITEQGFAHILPFLREGITEREVALELEFYMRKNGAQDVSFPSVVVSGANGSRPHGVPTDKPIRSGDFVTMDFGALYNGYHADMTRTVAIGHVSDEQRFAYETVLKAQQATLGVICAGMNGKTADAAARTIIQEAGFGEYFGHGTGHGVGVEIHEAPRLSPMATDAPLPIHAVVTVEPGIYLPGKYGVRIEDMVLLTENGSENLTHSPKELLIL